MIGILIGSFNPPTKAHLEIALELKKCFSKIIFVPVNSRDKHLCDIKNRIEMLKLFCQEYDFLQIDDIMKEYSYVNYRVIDLLKKKYHNITLIIGSDLLDKLDTFDNYQYLLSNYRFMVVTRGNDVNKIIRNKYNEYQEHFDIFSYNSKVSSTMARELIKAGKDLDSVLDDRVSLYIKEHHLYF